MAKRGGYRPGAGRKSDRAARQREAAELLVARHMSPLDVMLKAMEHHAAAGNWDKAASFAKDAAPYLHARLQSIEVAGKPAGEPIQTRLINMTQEEYEEAARRVLEQF